MAVTVSEAQNKTLTLLAEKLEAIEEKLDEVLDLARSEGVANNGYQMADGRDWIDPYGG